MKAATGGTGISGITLALRQSPPKHVLDLLAAATAHQPVADAFANGFADPARFASQVATPEATASFVSETMQLLEV